MNNIIHDRMHIISLYCRLVNTCCHRCTSLKFGISNVGSAFTESDISSLNKTCQFQRLSFAPSGASRNHITEPLSQHFKGD